MKATVFDVLMYLFDHYFEDYYEITPDHDTLKQELLQAGFGDMQIDKAFDWLEGLASQSGLLHAGAGAGGNSLRLFNELELEKLDRECRGFILFLEQTGVLDTQDREVVIDRVMALEAQEINIQQLKWVVLMVLLNQPGKEAAFTWIEDIVMDEMNISLH